MLKIEQSTLYMSGLNELEFDILRKKRLTEEMLRLISGIGEA